MSVDEAVGTAVHRLMWDRRVTQVQLAERTGIDRSSLSKKMRGARPWSVRELVVIAGELRVSPDELLAEATRGVSVSTSCRTSAGQALHRVARKSDYAQAA